MPLHEKTILPLLLTSKGTLLHVLRPLLCDLEDSWPPLCKLITKRYCIHLFFPKVLMSPLPGNWQREIFIRHTYDFKNHGMAMYQEEPYPETTKGVQQKVAWWATECTEKAYNRVSTTKGCFQWSNRILSGAFVACFAISITIIPGLITAQIPKYKWRGYTTLRNNLERKKEAAYLKAKNKHHTKPQHQGILTDILCQAQGIHEPVRN